jgi:hypothetical protein
MNGFSLAGLGAHCAAISHSANATASEIADFVPEIPESHHAQLLASLAQVLFTFSTGVSHFEGAIHRATAISPTLQRRLNASLEQCQIHLAPARKQVLRLEPSTLPMMNTTFLTAHIDLLVTYAQLFGFYEEVLAMYATMVPHI